VKIGNNVNEKNYSNPSIQQTAPFGEIFHLFIIYFPVADDQLVNEKDQILNRNQVMWKWR